MITLLLFLYQKLSFLINFIDQMLEQGIWLQWDRGYEWLVRQPATEGVCRELEEIYEPEFRAHVGRKLENLSHGTAT